MELGYYWALYAKDNKWQIVEIVARLPEHVLYGGYAWPRAAYSEFDGPIVRGATGTEGEINRLTNAGLDAAYGETMQADEAEHWIAACDRLTAERDALRKKLAEATRLISYMNTEQPGEFVTEEAERLRAEIEQWKKTDAAWALVVRSDLAREEALRAERDDLAAKLAAAQAELHDLRIRAGLGEIGGRQP